MVKGVSWKANCAEGAYGATLCQLCRSIPKHSATLIAEDDYVVVECRGEVTTKSGKPYNNTYCYVCRISDGKLKELTEYMDTQLVVETFADLM
jgi:ketosteroid isomerase-like protein